MSFAARLALVLALVAITSTTNAEDAPKPVRLATGVSGHIHPAACVTKAGTVLVIFSQSNYKDLRLARSTDGGKTWTEPAAFKHTEKLEIYPGSLTALRDGRVDSRVEHVVQGREEREVAVRAVQRQRSTTARRGVNRRVCRRTRTRSA